MVIDALFFDQLLRSMATHPWVATVVILGASIALVTGMHLLARGLNDGRHPWQQRLRARLGVPADKKFGEMKWLLLTMHFFLWQFVVYLLLHAWGLHDESEAFLRALFSHGFTVGGVRIVIGKLLGGVLAFVVLFTFTRWLRRKLERDWLVRAGVEPSTRDTVATLFGYITFVIALLVGLSYAGLDLGKLAIVAGALSVGIGFGLQNIVSNFVSGIILLFERPVRIGDFIDVGGSQGIVRKMRIRATEIETADRETIIVPNSNLISNPVRNRNLRTRMSRVVLNVSVAHGSDPKQVSDLLKKVAAQHASVRGTPAVQFTNFGPSSLDFELSAPIADAEAKGGIASDLRFAIIAAFKDAGIELPSPKQDVWVRGLPAAAPAGGDRQTPQAS
jgi:potassium efflux system protein